PRPRRAPRSWAAAGSPRPRLRGLARRHRTSPRVARSSSDRPTPKGPGLLILPAVHPARLERVVTEFVPALEARLGIQLPHTLDEVLGDLRGGEAQILTRLGEFLKSSLATLPRTAPAAVGVLRDPVLP